MKRVNFFNVIFLFVLVLVVCSSKSSNRTDKPVEIVESIETSKSSDTKIQVAILLDTSNSMDGLIEQAKSRLWNIVNTLTTLKFKGKSPQIEISLYEYGNLSLKKADDWIRQVVPFTTDLDVISGKLFALTTYGGEEYCGAVIAHAVKKLDWGQKPSDMKLIYIAGNESFDQGSVSYRSAVTTALGNNIFVNTIHCGNTREGINGHWRDAATIGKGKYFNIDHNVKVRFIETPYDDKISMYNIRLNDTYIAYGEIGQERKEYQAVQDINAESVSASNKTERIVSKARSVYKNESWDLVDMVKQDSRALEKIDNSNLPKELKGKSTAEVQAFVNEKLKDREAIQREINELAVKRQEYIDNEIKNTNDDGDDLGKAIAESIMVFAAQKGYDVE